MAHLVPGLQACFAEKHPFRELCLQNPLIMSKNYKEVGQVYDQVIWTFRTLEKCSFHDEINERKIKK
jgi:hypothetical protein